MTHSVKTTNTQPQGAWSGGVEPLMTSTFKACQVDLEPLGPSALRLSAVPLTKDYNKPRTNVLVQREGGLVRAYVDDDLTYQGSNLAIAAALSGHGDRKWRQLAVHIPVGDVSQVLRTVLDALGSPVMTIMRIELEEGVPGYAASPRVGKVARPTADSLDPRSILAVETRAVVAAQLAVSFKSNNHKPLARRLAVALTRQPPCGGVLWGPSGTGKGQLLEATGHLLMQGGHVQSVRHLSAARLACGRVYPAERDRALSMLLDELVARPQLLLLVDHLDLGLSGTMCGLTLLAEALDRGARILATVQSAPFLAEIAEIPEIARRLLPIKVPTASRSDTLKALHRLARSSSYEVSPAAIEAAAELSSREGATQPAAAVQLLSAALAEAGWRANQQITPDDVTSVLTPVWPE